jgi:hypothetical protein
MKCDRLIRPISISSTHVNVNPLLTNREGWGNTTIGSWFVWRVQDLRPQQWVSLSRSVEVGSVRSDSLLLISPSYLYRLHSTNHKSNTQRNVSCHYFCSDFRLNTAFLVWTTCSLMWLPTELKSAASFIRRMTRKPAWPPGDHRTWLQNILQHLWDDPQPPACSLRHNKTEEEVNEDEMGGAWSMRGAKRSIRSLVRKPEGKRPLWKSTCR